MYSNSDLIGVDFTSAPTKKKPIALARAHWDGPVLAISELHSYTKHEQLQTVLQQGFGAPYIAAIDMPFGLSRELVDGLNWPGAGRMGLQAWRDLMTFYCSLKRDDIRSIFKAWCDAKPAGSKLAHRRCDGPAGASPSMKWVNPPVAYMLHAGAPILMNAQVHIPGMQQGDPQRVALEAYPGYLARKVLGRQSYKTDDTHKDSADRRMARSELLCALEDGMLFGMRVSIRPYLRARLLEDPQADHLDAVLCCLGAAWAQKRADLNFGLPTPIDPVEGWIVGVQPVVKP